MGSEGGLITRRRFGFKFGFVELLFLALPALFALSPLRARVCEEAPRRGSFGTVGKHLSGNEILLG